MIYEYKCSNPSCECDTFTTSQSIKEDPLKICPYCNQESISRTFHAVPVFVNGDYKTLGALADANRKKLGRSYIEDKQRQYEEDKLNASQYAGKLPDGASIIKREKKDTPWRKKNEKIDMSLNRLTKEQQQKYILTGKK